LYRQQLNKDTSYANDYGSLIQKIENNSASCYLGYQPKTFTIFIML